MASDIFQRMCTSFTLLFVTEQTLSQYITPQERITKREKKLERPH